MREFYENLASTETPNKVRALQMAQQKLITGVTPPNAPLTLPGHDDARPYAHPFYWAPFILMGNWQ